MEESRCAFKILTGKPTGNRSFRMPGLRWEGNNRVDLKEIVVIRGI